MSREPPGNEARSRPSAALRRRAAPLPLAADPVLRAQLLERLNDALATAIVGVLRYRRHSFMAGRQQATALSRLFLAHSREQQSQADLIAGRIVQLGGEPEFSPDQLSGRSHTVYIEGSTLPTMIREDLIAERIAIDSHRETLRYLGDRDPGTRRLLLAILAAGSGQAPALPDWHDRPAQRG